MPWFKGNLHCHSNRSDGRALPRAVAKFYGFNDYDFLGISDHNRYTDMREWTPGGGIIGIPCCEFTSEEYCHVLSVNTAESVTPDPKGGYGYQVPKKALKGIGKDMGLKKARILQYGVDRVLAAGGIPVLCHPFWHWTYDAKIASLVKNWRHFEICNAAPDCNSYPLPGYEPGDNMWDELLSAGARVFGIACDDAHEYYLPYSPYSSCAGRGFLMVKSAELTRKAVAAAFSKGHFYASTGIRIEDYRVGKKEIRIGLRPFGQEKALFQFFGVGGEELMRTIGESARYRFTGREIYVRIRMSGTGGFWAWTQPVFLDDLGAAMKWTNAD